MIFQGAIMNKLNLVNSAKAAVVGALMAVAAAGYAGAADMPTKTPPKPPPAPPFFFVNDTSVSFVYYFAWDDPGVSGSADSVPGGIGNTGNKYGTAQGVVEHFDIWQYGATLLHLEVNQNSKQDPIGGQPGSTGSREFFGFAQETFSGNALTNSKIFTTPFTNDVGVMVRLTAGVQNDFLMEETTQYAVGGNFDLAIPKILGGSMQVGITAYKEYSNNQFNACGPPGFGVATPLAGFTGGFCSTGVGASFSGARDFEWTWKLFEFNALALGPLLGSWADSLSARNIASVTGPKGTGISNAQCLALGCFGALGAFNNNETKVEVFEDVRLVLDTSKMFWGKPGIWDSFVGYRYFYNQFGTNHNAALFAGCTTCNGGGPGGAPGTNIISTAYVGMDYHFK